MDRLTIIGALALSAMLPACTATSASGPETAPHIGTISAPYQAHGTEPFWGIEIAGDTLTYTPMDGAPVSVSGYETHRTATGWRYSGSGLAVDIESERCSDGMSDIVYRDTVRVSVDGQTLDGCGGGGADLALDGTRWQGVASGGVNWQGAEIAFINGQMTGMVGCRELERPYIHGDDWIAFGYGRDSANGCPAALQPFERDFMPIFEGRANIHQGIEGQMILSDGHNEMRFVPMTFCETKCAPIAEVAPVEQDWSFIYVDGDYISPGDRLRYTLSLSGGRFSAQAGCNRMSGRYSVDGDRIAFRDAAMTRMACTGAAGEHEAALIALTREPVRFQTSPYGHLLLSDGVHVIEARAVK